MARKKQRTVKSQKNQNVPDMTEEQAREHLEALRWPNGVTCIACTSKQVYKLGGNSTRIGLIKCRECKAQFSVMVGTIMEDSHLPLAKWVKAFHYMASSKKGMSALQLMRNLGLGSYKTAWHLAHRIRYAMASHNPTSAMLSGIVEVDETYIGGKPRKTQAGEPTGKGHTGRGTRKTPVVVLVQRGGNAASKVVEHVDGKTLKAAVHECVSPTSTLMTDEWLGYSGIGAGYQGGHNVIKHAENSYVNGNIYTNTAESYFALLKRGVIGTFHHISKQHLHRYCAEFDFRWNGRFLTDAERRTKAIQQIEGKRLMYKDSAKQN